MMEEPESGYFIAPLIISTPITHRIFMPLTASIFSQTNCAEDAFEMRDRNGIQMEQGSPKTSFAYVIWASVIFMLAVVIDAFRRRV